MAQTISLSALDDATREYLLDVREREGRGAPGVFAPVNPALAGCGCVMGPIIIILTLVVCMFTNWVYRTPARTALLMTAGLLSGGWMLVAAFRVWGGKNSQSRAGTWVYGDSLYLYEALGDEIRITPVDDVREAQFTHNYNNGAYQNSVVKLLMPGNHIVSASVNHEQRAEQMVVYYNYLAWARGPEGGERADLDPAVLGGLAKYVAKNDNEPLDASGNINLNLIELDMESIPTEPANEGGGGMNPLPYLVILAAGVGLYFGSKAFIVPFRDNKMHKTVTTEPVEPRFLRMYLVDPWAKKHKDAVQKRLAAFYATPISHVSANARDAALKEGMLAVLEELKTASQPVVSVRVTEAVGPGTDGAAERTKKVRETVADSIVKEFIRIAPAVSPPAGKIFTTQPPPIGVQLIEFVEAPEGANAHFDISYKFEPAEAGNFKVTYTVTIRTKADDGAEVAKKTFALTRTYSAFIALDAAKDLGEQLFRDMVGTPGGVGGVQ